MKQMLNQKIEKRKCKNENSSFLSFIYLLFDFGLFELSILIYFGHFYLKK